MNKNSASVLLGAVQGAGDQLMAALHEIQGDLSPEDLARWKEAVGRSMGALYKELLEPIYQEHPDLVAKALGVRGFET